MIGIGESFFIPFAVFLKANNIQIGLLSSLPQLLGSLSQIFFTLIFKLFNTRKKLVVISALIQGAMYIPIALVFFQGGFRVYYLLIFTCLYWIFGMILVPAWSSWMGDLTDENMRGAYFGKRNKINGFSTFASFLFGGYILQSFGDGIESQYKGFIFIFALAFIARALSCYYLTIIHEPDYAQTDEAMFSFFDFIKEMRFSNYGLFVLYYSLMSFSVYVSAPFFTPYMLVDLNMSYTSYTLITAAAIIFKLISMPIWGAAVDRFGTKKVLGLSGFLMPVIPLLWFFSANFYYLFLVETFSGFAWGGYEIASFNFIFDSTAPSKRSTYVAYFNVLNGLALFAGAIVGSVIVKYNNTFWSKYLLVFVLSFFLRYLSSFIFLPKIKEVRKVEEIPYRKLLLKVVSTLPTAGLVYQLVTLKKGIRNSSSNE